MSTSALVVVDVQVDFCEGGALAVARGNAVAEGVARLIAGEHGYDHVLATRDWHVEPGRHFADGEPDFATTWPRHCVAETAGAALHPALADVAFDAVFSKGQHDDGYSGFDGTDGLTRPLSAYLRAHDVEAVDVVGIATDHCVRATALDAAHLGWPTRVLDDLIAGVDEEASRAALAELTEAGAEVVRA